MARPRNRNPTSQKTWMIYDDDINTILELGKQPKEVFRLGLMALENGWHPAQNSSNVEDLKKRIQSLSWTLQSYVEKFNKLAHIVEKGLNIEVTEDVIKTKELERRLVELDKLEKTVNQNESLKNFMIKKELEAKKNEI